MVAEASQWAKWVVQHLLPWYQENRRILPWRENPTPYSVLVSEFMLQQTQVNTVLPYFQRFMEKFPDFKTLAKANLEDVLSLWSGLGYYQRARNLHKTAQVVCELYDGQFPEQYGDVIDLPGIGRYTAGAILSIAFKQNLPLLDGNVIRLLTRLKHWTEPVSSLQEDLWNLSESLVEETRVPEQLNQALMELPALICLPRTPKCLICPLQEKCASRGRAENIPNKGSKKEIQKIQKIVPVIYTAEFVLLKQHQNQVHLNALYDFPWLDSAEELDPVFGKRDWNIVSAVQHSIMSTQYRLIPYLLEVGKKQKKNIPLEWKWMLRKRLNQDVPLTGSAKKMLRLIPEEHGRFAP